MEKIIPTTIQGTDGKVLSYYGEYLTIQGTFYSRTLDVKDLKCVSVKRHADQKYIALIKSGKLIYGDLETDFYYLREEEENVDIVVADINERIWGKGVAERFCEDIEYHLTGLGNTRLIVNSESICLEGKLGKRCISFSEVADINLSFERTPICDIVIFKKSDFFKFDHEYTFSCYEDQKLCSDLVDYVRLRMQKL